MHGTGKKLKEEEAGGNNNISQLKFFESLRACIANYLHAKLTFEASDVCIFNPKKGKDFF